MRFFIAFLLLFCCYSSSLQAKKAAVGSSLQKAVKESKHISKKQRNSLKTDFLSNQLDFLNLSNQHHFLVAAFFVKLALGSLPALIEKGGNYKISSAFFYSFIFKHLYPKHSFW